MDQMPVNRLRFKAKTRPHFGTYDSSDRGPHSEDDQEWAPKQLHELLDEVATAPPTLRERLENWGSD